MSLQIPTTAARILATNLAIMTFHNVAQAFRRNSQLQQFILTDVSPTGNILGTGSFGSVEEVSQGTDSISKTSKLAAIAIANVASCMAIAPITCHVCT